LVAEDVQGDQGLFFFMLSFGDGFRQKDAFVSGRTQKTGAFSAPNKFSIAKFIFDVNER